MSLMKADRAPRLDARPKRWTVQSDNTARSMILIRIECSNERSDVVVRHVGSVPPAVCLSVCPVNPMMEENSRHISRGRHPCHDGDVSTHEDGNQVSSRQVMDEKGGGARNDMLDGRGTERVFGCSDWRFTRHV